jgi:diadenylate cyclase
MIKMLDSLVSLWTKRVWVHLADMGLNDVIDIALLSLMLYYVYRFIRDRRASKLLIGLCVVVGILVFSYIFHLESITFIFQNFFQVGLTALIILFQPELRSALEKVGNTPISLGVKRLMGDSVDQAIVMEAIDSICDAVFEMSRSKTGALIVFERATKLGEFTKDAVILNAHISRRLIGNIFFNRAPLHDGAMIIRDYRIYAASCMLPLAGTDEVTASLGTRHRAAIGVSEVSDAVVVVVSEETGIVSLAINGTLKRNYKRLTLKQDLRDILIGPNNKNLQKNSASQNKNK